MFAFSLSICVKILHTKITEIWAQLKVYDLVNIGSPHAPVLIEHLLRIFSHIIK